MSDAKGFLKFEREEIPRRPVQARVQDWNEVDLTPSSELLQIQSRRCMDCGVAFCQSETGCPVHNSIPEWNDLVRLNRWQEASARLHATNNFPEFTGRLCPAPCERACVLGVIAEPVNIKSIEWGIVEKAFAEGWIRSEKPTVSTGRRVAVIGSGPAGLTAAQELIRLGHAVTVFEKSKLLGGLLRYGIPDFKMQKSVIDRRLAQLIEEGVEFRTGVELGRDIKFEQIRQEFDATVLAVGAENPRDLQIPGRDLKGIHFAMDYLAEQNRLISGEIRELNLNARDKRVIILGGGDTGSDCLGTALRQGARHVLQFEIQQRTMKLKSSHAHEEGGWREWSMATTEFVGKFDGEFIGEHSIPGGHVQKLKARRVETGEELVFETDMVILALGFTGVNSRVIEALPGVNLTSAGTFATNSEWMTHLEGVFACGDSRRGASLIVWAISEGRKLAASVHRYLNAGIPVSS